MTLQSSFAATEEERCYLAPPGLEDVVEERKAKYMVWLESDEEDSSSKDESSSDE